MAAARSSARPMNLDVVIERLDNLRDAVEDLHSDTSRRFDALDAKFVPRDLYEERHTNLSARVTALETRFSRIAVTLGGFVLTTIGGVIAALVSKH